MSSNKTPPVQTTTTVQNNDPADWAKPSLQALGSRSLEALNSGDLKVSPYGESTVVPWSDQTQTAMGQMEAIGTQGSPIFGNALNSANDIITSGGMTPEQRQSMQQLQQVGSGQYRPEQAVGVAGLTETASGANLDGNPFLDRILNTGAEQIGTQVNNSAGSAGRYGSGAHQGVMADSIGDFTNQVLGQNYQMERGLQTQAQGQLISAGQGQDSLATGAAGSAFNAGRGATADVMNAGQAAPNLFQGQMIPSDILQQVGGMNEDLAGRNLQDLINRHNAGELGVFDELQRFSGLTNGVVQTGGTTTSTAQTPMARQPSTLERIAGLGIGGLGAFGGFM